MEALVYKGLLLRYQATLEKDPAKQQELLKQATALKDEAEALEEEAELRRLAPIREPTVELLELVAQSLRSLGSEGPSG